MNANPTQRNSTRGRRISWGKRGFALVVTLSLMILLTIIAVGLLTLSSISLRASAQSSAASIARTNARLAMMLALGELQKTLGPDQAVSAPASAVVKDAKKKQPHLTGAWQADQDLAASSDGDPIWHWVPNSSDSPKYSEKQNRFKGWLVSTTKPEDAERLDFANAAAPTTGKDAVDLIGDSEDPLKDSEGVVTTVVGRKVKVASVTQPGKYAWAVFDESTKAAVDLGDPKTAQSAGEEIASRTVPNRFRADVLDSRLSSLKTPENLISLETATVPAKKENVDVAEFRRRFHDFTTGSLGLLTDTAKGGLKKDLTSAFEASDKDFVAPTAITPYPDGFTAANGAPTWKYLRNHYRKYKNLTGGAGESIYSLTSPEAKGTDLKVITKGAATGVQPAPDVERLLPVIAKLQLVFSVVAHHEFAVFGRREFFRDYGDYGDPKKFENYGVIHLVYDPVITLYNPYDVTLDLKNTRIRIWDPPVGFRFSKIDNRAGTTSLFRPIGGDEAPKDTDGFVGLAQFQRDQEDQKNARKCFTLRLGTADRTSSRLLNSNWKLKPGEVKVFSPRVPDNWTWGMETGSNIVLGKSGTFFDFAQGRNFGNVDNRETALDGGRYGVECAPGVDTRAGLQTDHLATDHLPRRNSASMYEFERKAKRNDGFVTMRKSDAVKAEAKPLVRSGAAVTQFQVDVLAGLSSANASGAGVSTDTSNLEEIGDTLRSYRFNFTGLDPKEELSEHPEDPIIETTQTVERILQPDSPAASQTGKKVPFAMLEMSARTTKSETTDSKPWLYNNFIVEGGEQKTSVVGLTTQSYDLRLREIQSFDGTIPIDGQKRGFFGAADSIGEGGSSFINMLHVPMAPTASLGDLIHSNLVSSAVLPRVVHPFGNSRAHPLIPANRVAKTLGTMMMDHSYLLNDALWDSYFFSSLAPYGGSKGGVMTEARALKKVLEGVFDGTKPALNNRLVPAVPGDPEELAATVGDLSDLERSRQVAKYVAVNGPFNVNSTSVDAWRAVLSSLRDRQVNGLEIVSSANNQDTLQATTYDSKGETPLARAGRPLADSTPPANLRWAGIRALTDTQIEDLAKRIVEEITNRGVADSAPSLTLGEFVNRRIDSAGGLQTLAGLLQTAIDNSTINSDPDVESDSKTLSAASINAKRKTGVEIEKVLDGKSAEGAPTMVTQGDLMAALAPIATVRGDTFKIRSYGEATSTDGNTILARAWCEAVVQRVPDYVDPTDTAETAITALKAGPNKTFGRQFHIVSFRWLNNAEI